MLVGCSTNEITVANSGTNVWQKVEVSAGGNRFDIGKLEAGEFKTIRFRSKHERGGLITGEINDEILEEVIETIKSVAHTGKIGDGKIFISNIEEIIRIRTGEKNSDAI